MTYILGEVSSPFGAHGRGAHEVRSVLGEVSSPFGAHGRGAHEVRSVLGSAGIFVDRGQLGYVLGGGSSPFGAHGRGAHEVRSMLGEVSSPFGAHGRGAHEVRSALGGFNGLGDAAVLANIAREKQGLPPLTAEQLNVIRQKEASDQKQREGLALALIAAGKFAAPKRSGVTNPLVRPSAPPPKVAPGFKDFRPGIPTAGGGGFPDGGVPPGDEAPKSSTGMIVAAVAALGAIAFALSRKKG
jgi:hypothetical protein